MKKYDYSKERLEAIVPLCRSYADVERALGMPVSGCSTRTISRQIEIHKISKNHFWKPGERAIPRKPRMTPAERLRVLPPGSRRPNGWQLRKDLVSIGVPYACSGTGCPIQNAIWLGSSITLQVDHIDGNPLNNLKENLRFLCPNCHSQTDNFAGRNNKIST